MKFTFDKQWKGGGGFSYQQLIPRWCGEFLWCTGTPAKQKKPLLVASKLSSSPSLPRSPICNRRLQIQTHSKNCFSKNQKRSSIRNELICVWLALSFFAKQTINIRILCIHSSAQKTHNQYTVGNGVISCRWCCLEGRVAPAALTGNPRPKADGNGP